MTIFQSVFGDDEHTAADGVYTRVLKTRKWLYFSSVGGLILSLGLYNEVAAANFLTVISLPEDVLSASTFAALAYLLLQYSFLIFQLVATYDIVMRERLTFQRDDALSSARDTKDKIAKQLSDVEALSFERWHKEKEKEIDAATDEIDQLNASLHELQYNQENLRSSGSGDISDPTDATVITLIGNRHDISRLKARLAVKRDSLKRLTRAYEEGPKRDDSDQVMAIRTELNKAVETYEKILRDIPANRLGYRNFETLIDFIRIAPPAVLATVVIVRLWPW